MVSNGPKPIPRLSPTQLARFVAKLDKSSSPTGCWLWTGARTSSGYGAVSLHKRLRLAHRVALQELGGQELDPGLTVHHKCYQRLCQNPDHLEQVTRIDNARDTLQGRREMCAKGHEYTPENTRTRPASRPGRVCKECAREYDRKYRSKGRV